MAGLIAMLRQIEAAEDHARTLRAQYGPLAEQHCQEQLSVLDRRDTYRSHLLDVLRALPWVSDSKDIQLH
jgi:hypothetical protein